MFLRDMEHQIAHTLRATVPTPRTTARTLNNKAAVLIPQNFPLENGVLRAVVGSWASCSARESRWPEATNKAVPVVTAARRAATEVVILNNSTTANSPKAILDKALQWVTAPNLTTAAVMARREVTVAMVALLVTELLRAAALVEVAVNLVVVVWA